MLKSFHRRLNSDPTLLDVVMDINVTRLFDVETVQKCLVLILSYSPLMCQIRVLEFKGFKCFTN